MDKIWIVVSINGYNGPWASDYAGLKVFKTIEEAEAYADIVDSGYAMSTEIEEISLRDIT